MTNEIMAVTIEYEVSVMTDAMMEHRLLYSPQSMSVEEWAGQSTAIAVLFFLVGLLIVLGMVHTL